MERQDSSLLSELLPGIRNDVTLNIIAPKCPWEVFPVLYSVSTTWQKAILGRHVLDARIRSHSTETLAVVNQVHVSQDINAISLYSTKRKAFTCLPPIPGLKGGFPSNCRFISLGEKIYVLGGLRCLKVYPWFEPSRRNVYVIDLTGQMEWQQCASMKQERLYFGCCALHGKIYVFGGMLVHGSAVFGSEVYDPLENNWSPIMPMEHKRILHHVTPIREELYVHGGSLSSLQIYNPVTDEWRVGRDLNNGCTIFFVRGKLYWMGPSSIWVDDFATKAWKHRHTFSLDGPGLLPTHVYVEPICTLHVDNELLAIVLWYLNSTIKGSCLIQSTGFDGENVEIKWEKVEGYRGDYEVPSPFMSCIQL